MVELRKQIKSEGVVLKRTNYGEADRIVTLYTKHYGKLVCLAKGTRRTSSKKRASIELFSQIRFYAVSGRGLDILAETEIIDSFTNIRKDLVKISSAYQLCELVDRLTVEKNDQEVIYFQLVKALEQISNSENQESEEIVYEFAGNLVKELGFWPKEKALPTGISLFSFIEDTIERRLKSKSLLKNFH